MFLRGRKLLAVPKKNRQQKTFPPWVTEEISGESRRDEDLLERPVDLGPSGVAHGEPPEGYGKTVPGKPEQAPGAVVHEGETVLAEPAGEREEGAGLRPSCRRSVRGSDQPSGGEPGEKAAPTRIPTEDERLAVEPAEQVIVSRMQIKLALNW